MDVTHAKTFLAIVEAGNFVEASRRIFVTQSTVSARIKVLEQQLGKPLFIRSKGGCELTAAGHQFYRFARSMVQVWEEARHQVAVPAGFDDTLIIGGQYSLWNHLLLPWVSEFQREQPRVALRCEVGMPQRLMREMAEGVLDLAVIYRPEQRPNMHVEELFADELVLVTARPEVPFRENYIFVDWGDTFRAEHAAAFPDIHNPGLTLDLGALGINMLLQMGGAGYFPQRTVSACLEDGRLKLVPGTPAFNYPAFVVWQDSFSTPEIIEAALGSLHAMANRAWGAGDRVAGS